jgi:hypothetical protein
MADSNNIQAFMGSLIKEAESNPQFRERFISNPKDVLEEKLNFKLPEDFEVIVHQDTPQRLNIVLPLQSEELSEIELEAISGAGCYTHNDCGEFKEF